MWRHYRENAVDKQVDAELLLRERRYIGAYESAFFAIEIAFKAWILRMNPDLGSCSGTREALRKGMDPVLARGFFSHDLRDVLDAAPKLEGGLQVGSPEAYNLLTQLMGDALIWKPWMRYRGSPEKETAELYVKVAKGLQLWMLANLLSD